MKQKILMMTLCSAVLMAPVFAKAQVNLTTDQQKLGYVFGYNVGKNFHDHQVSVDTSMFAQGLNAGLSGSPAEMTPAQMQAVVSLFQKEMSAKQADTIKKSAEENKKSGEAFMKNFVAQKEVNKVDGTLAYKVMTKGTGPMPSLTDTVMITYDGKLTDGKTFDSTKRNGDKPVALKLQQVIPGMQKILTMMPVGSTWEVVIDSTAAYGVKGIPYSPIGPNETLIFDLSLKSIVPAASVKPITPVVSGAKA